MIAPIACTLDAGASRARWASWARLDPPRRLVESHPRRLVFRFPSADGERLLELVRAERECCGFVGWEVKSEGEHLELTISGDEMGVAAITAQFGLERQ